MNIDYHVLFEYFIGSFSCCFGSYLIAMITLKRKAKTKSLFNIFMITILTVLTILNSFIFNNIAKIFGILIAIFFIYKKMFLEKNKRSFFLAIFTYIFFILGEITFVFVTSMLDFIFQLNITTMIVRSFFANGIISVLACCFAFIFRKLTLNYIGKIDKTNISVIFISGVIMILVVISSIYNLYLNDWKVDYKFFLNTIIILGCVALILVLFKQYFKNKEIDNKYKLLEEYMKTSAELIEKYSSTIHKYKNNLITIKGYMKSDMKEANKYIDGLLDNFKTKKYNWFSKINYIKIDTLRYLIYYKLSKAEDSNLKIFVDVSEQIIDMPRNIVVDNNLNTLLEILGEYFDNAIYASGESKEKELNLMLYMEKNKIIFKIANTYDGKVDLSSITKNGYTTKGKGHGFGLYDIEKTIKNVDCFECKYELLDNYFLLTLIIYFS